MLLKIHKDNPQPRLIEKVVECLKNDGVIIYPTDTVYGLGCDIKSKKAIERICLIKNLDPEKNHFSCICENVSIISEYAVGVSTPVYKLMKKALPGPYTFILKASKNIPRHFQSPKKTVGIRVVDHPIPTEIVRLLGNPIVTTSLKHEDEIIEYNTDPELIYEKYKKLVDIVIDAGAGGNIPSTVIDCSDENNITVLREGLGDPSIIHSVI
ncbi:MAG: L-threonylcarbamoyladenylate synthase [Bacteroidia bacterium]|nr:L-threonylcarbamoyladenylate synthase [Bacteroidia bacterium]MDW8159354.1 L-threonylcarbamoyladenylate synthase [Bacteroidia bacterium]